MRYKASWVFRCPYWIYLKTKYPEYDKFPSEYVRKGRLAEDEFKKYLRKRNERFQEQIRLKYVAEDYTITGRADFMTPSRIYEVKHVIKFRKPPKNWIGQLNLYLGMSGKKNGSVIEFNGKKFREYRFDFSSRLFEESIAFFDRIHSGNYRRNLKQCRFCNYSFICLK